MPLRFMRVMYMNNLENKVKETPQQVRYTTLDYAFTNMGDLRTDFLKTKFNDIIDNIVSTENK